MIHWLELLSGSARFYTKRPSRLQEVTIRGGGLKHVACAEDEDFIQALDKMMLENLQVGLVNC